MVILIAILGLCLGSFAYVLALRLHDGRDWVRGRSECENCHYELQPRDLVPLFSWLSSAGKCRKCKTNIGYSYPAVELFTAGLLAVSYISWPNDFSAIGIVQFALWAVFMVLMVSLIISDLKWYLLPDKLVLPAAIVAALFQLTLLIDTKDPKILFGISTGVAVGSGIFYLLYKLSDGKYIGGGDVKFGIVYGILLGSGLESAMVIGLASLLGTLVALPLIATKRSTLTSKIPFGPYLIIATIIVFLFGSRLIDALGSYYLFP